MSEEAGEKKFDLSERRRQKLREEGNIPRSQDISTTITLAAGLAMMVGGGGALIEYLREMMAQSFTQLAHSAASTTGQSVGSVFSSGLWIWLGIFVGTMAIAVLVTQVSQVGINFADDALSLKFEKLNPISGFSNLFSVSKLVTAGQNFIKLGVVAGFAWFSINDLRNSPVFARPVSLPELGGAYVNVAWSLGWRIVAVLTALAAADYLYQLWKFNHDHMMTLEEVKDERRSQEASPEILKKRKLIGRKTSMRRMMENMKDATIVVTNPTHYAVALRYRRGIDEVPVVVAKGIRKSALRLKEHAYDLRIAVRENKPLARGLYKHGKVDQPIPAIFYQGVAIILASLFRQGFQSTDGRAERDATRAEIDELFNDTND
jgi:flagellar biosynthesis protein FlhB